jgi:hypothetical protein
VIQDVGCGRGRVPQPRSANVSHRELAGNDSWAQWKAESGNRRVCLETIKQDRKRLQARGFVGVARK